MTQDKEHNQEMSKNEKEYNNSEFAKREFKNLTNKNIKIMDTNQTTEINNEIDNYFKVKDKRCDQTRWKENKQKKLKRAKDRRSKEQMEICFNTNED